MAVTAFANDIHTKMNNIQGDFLAKDATWDDTNPLLEDCQLATIAYVLVKAIRARQRSANARDRVFASRIGPYSEAAFLVLASMVQHLYNEFRVAANGVDTPETDDPWDTNFLNRGTGPQGGPVH